MDKKLKRQLYDLVADDQVDDAIELLQDKLSIDHPSYLRLIKLARRFRELDDQSMDAIIAQEDAKLAKNQIADTLLHIVQTMDRPPIEEVPVTPPPPKVSVKEEATPSPPPKPADAFRSKPGSREGFFGTVQYRGSMSMKEKKITLATRYEEAWNRCLGAISAAGMSLDAQDRANGSIEASTSGNFITSFGERVLIFVTPVNDQQTSVHIIVDSVLKTMVVDWGRNNNKLNLLVSHLL
ncbi:hypothetical protein [Neolewinella agarilytica]|uniref:Effector-associated domain-containing protein n=1 Tax=Neolewinella agarilytica TaxID=478744 RepID=A0A1H8YX21_9BACT|nr:hypothetical protein [Neolewinella agarilytica]SEP56617.1 hypothetical protein SAMN05444359_10156 [Neolewinella agarilytica]